jgi:uncharacterized phiE125 gp8 family phage protein
MITERLNRSSVQPFDSADLEIQVRVTDTDQIAEAHRHALAAATELEHYAQLALLTQTIRVTVDAWPRSSWFALPIAPVIDPLSPTVTVDGVAFDGFAVVGGMRPALRLTGDRPCGLIVIEYEAGFGADADAIPADLQLAILDQATATYDERGAGGGKTAHTSAVSPHMARIAARYRRVAL